MAGSLPRTAYLLTLSGVVIGEFSSLADITQHLGISIDDEGYITFMGDKVHPEYALKSDTELGPNGFTKLEAMRDWSKCYLDKNLTSSYKIYRYIL
jgi:hypothetical protein